jgi:hypothetical protein
MSAASNEKIPSASADGRVANPTASASPPPNSSAMTGGNNHGATPNCAM